MHSVKEFIPAQKINVLQRQHYGLFGHSAVKLCHYTKTALRKKKFCYKRQFYGIKSHQCIQFTPASNFCNQECVFCWRTLGWTKNSFKKYDEPKEIVEGAIKAQIQLLSGFGGIQDPKKINRKLLLESKKPKHIAISLSGEPSLYPELPELIEAFREKGFSTFLVSNGSRPSMLKKCNPTQLYLSLDAPNKELFNKIDRPKERNAWKNLLNSLSTLKKHKSRTVVRITLVKGLNDCCKEEYAKLILKASPDFVEVKGYSWLGFSRKRLKKENVPEMKDVLAFTKKLNEFLEYKPSGRNLDARVVLLHNTKKGEKLKIDFWGQ
ncbi:MAG: 4-demethylwyosine synthase TYW1 [Candidatus Diapherotrites archaeon]